MKRYLKFAALAAVFTVVAAACGGGTTGPTGTGSGTGSGTSSVTDDMSGGTLKIAHTQDFFQGLDPTQEYYSVSWEFLRCCMARTLLSYTGKPAEEGGGVPTPDLATELPTESEDGLTWTFTIKDGVMFGDPLNREITAQDFADSIQRLSDPKINSPAYPFYYTAITGFSDAKGKPVEGMEVVDDKTLAIHLDVPEPDMPFLFTMAASAPLPRELLDTHYDGVELGQYLVSSGPYQWEGMEGFDLESEKPPSGMDIEKSYVLVRNPSWDPATDDLRKALVDRIEVASYAGEVQELLDKVDEGAIDWCIDCGATSATLKKYQADPELQERLIIHQADVLSYTGLNVFEPPFDDVHVRKAVNWALDKDAMWILAGGPPSGNIAGHFVPPGMMGGLNADYNPYPSEGNAGDIEAAKAEMALSKYDENADGVCDAEACTYDALTITGDKDAIQALQIMADSFEPLGLKLEIKAINYNALVDKCSTLAGHTTQCQAAWGKDYPSPYTFFFPLLDQGENGSNYSFMGATAEDLTAAGYSGFEVDDAGLGMPNITADIVACRAVPLGAEQDQCWADLDKKVMEEIAPLIPRRFPTDVDVLGSRIIAYSYDQFAGIGAIDQIAVEH
ncbi:MAG: ABC transporter substrate-binding protein [Actinomycetota bacterium]